MFQNGDRDGYRSTSAGSQQRDTGYNQPTNLRRTAIKRFALRGPRGHGASTPAEHRFVSNWIASHVLGEILANPPEGDRSGGGAGLGRNKGKLWNCKNAGKRIRARYDLNSSRLASA